MRPRTRAVNTGRMVELIRKKKMSRQEALDLWTEAWHEYENVKAQGLKLDMSRGKPDGHQLSLCHGLMDCVKDETSCAEESGIDCRNYGGVDGLPEAKKLFADLLGLTPAEIVVGGNSSLVMMFDNVASNMTHGVRDGVPWQKQGQVKFLCPVPGYDRHFAICQYFHIEMIPIEMTPDGPDMDTVERLVSEDELVKGIWCVPKYANPDGTVYSAETVRRFAALKPKAPDFRIYWDNAYFIHHLNGHIAEIPNLLREAEKYGNENMVLMFCSFSKISYAGAAIACMAASASNIEYIKKRLVIQTVGPDKLNQLRHVRYFGNAENVIRHMDKHAAIIRPKFELVLSELEKLEGFAEWTHPDGGYFISVNVTDGTAKRVVQLCAEAGVKLTEAGATYPLGIDPRDRNIRVAPTFPPLDELKAAMGVFNVAVRLAAAEKALAD